MDPNAALAEMRKLVLDVDGIVLDFWNQAGNNIAGRRCANVAKELANVVADLDQWLSRGGFPPEAWREGPDGPNVDQLPFPDTSRHCTFGGPVHLVSSDGTCIDCSIRMHDDLDDEEAWKEI